MIPVTDVIPLFLAVCPSLAEVWPELESDGAPDGGDGARLHYADAGNVAHHLVARLRAGATDEVRAGFEVIERLHVEGDDRVRELATIGYLEGIQNVAGWQPGCSPGDVEPFLGPESRRWWRGLDDFWSGKAPSATAVDD